MSSPSKEASTVCVFDLLLSWLHLYASKVTLELMTQDIGSSAAAARLLLDYATASASAGQLHTCTCVARSCQRFCHRPLATVRGAFVIARQELLFLPCSESCPVFS